MSDRRNGTTFPSLAANQIFSCNSNLILRSLKKGLKRPIQAEAIAGASECRWILPFDFS